MRPSFQSILALLFLVTQMFVGSDSIRKTSSRYAGPYKIKPTDVIRCNQSKPQPIEPFLYCNERNKTPNGSHHVYGNLTVRREVSGSKPYPIVYNVDLPIHIEIKDIPVFPYGRWKGHMKALEEKDAKSSIFCLNVLLEIVPK